MIPPQTPPPETELATLTQRWMWRGERPGYTMFGAYLGRLVVTDRRLLFLSTGSSGLLHQAIFRSAPRTDHLDFSALHRRGSLSLHLDRVEHSALARRRDFAWFLLIRTSSAAFTFMSKFGLDKGLLEEFQHVLEEQRARHRD